MFLERLFQQFTEGIIVFQGSNLFDAAEALEGSMVQLVDVGEMGIGHDDVGKRLDVAESVGYPTMCQ